MPVQLNIPRRAAAVLALALALPARAAWRLTDVEPVTRAGEAVAPVVAPNGRHVAYLVGGRLSVPGFPDVLTGRVWMVDRAAGSAERLGRLTVEAVQGEQTVSFAPKGGGYAYVEGDRAAPILWYVDGDGNRYRVGSGRSAAFSPDGDYLAYMVWDLSGTPAVEMWLFDTRRRESKRVSRSVPADPPDVAEEPRWTPDATRVVFRAGNDLYAYVRATGRVDTLTRTNDVRAFDIGPTGSVWYLRAPKATPDSGVGASAEQAGIWSARPDGRSAVRLFRADELPPGITGLTAGPGGSTLLFVATTAAGRGLVAADPRDGRWRFVAPADAFSLRRGGDLVAMEVAGPDGTRNIVAGRLVPDRDDAAASRRTSGSDRPNRASR